jgi:hypothetical protein
MKRLGTLLRIWIDRFMAWLKWPTAFLALAFLPGALLASIELLVQASLDPGR